jgi:hypothetical protein
MDNSKTEHSERANPRSRMRSQAIAFRVDHDDGDDASDQLAFVEQFVAAGEYAVLSSLSFAF